MSLNKYKYDYIYNNKTVNAAKLNHSYKYIIYTINSNNIQSHTAIMFAKNNEDK